MAAASLWQSAPLSGIKVVELAGLAPGPFCGLILADFGATVLRIDRAHPSAHLQQESTSPPSESSKSSSTQTKTPSPILPPPTNDSLTRNKASIALNLKSPRGLDLLRNILATADVLIDPFRPGVLESLNLAPETLHKTNPRLIIARLTGFRRDGPYAPMAGHDINYLAVSGVLSQLGRFGAPGASDPQPPDFPANLLADFAGGGLMCATGILLALLARERRGGTVLNGPPSSSTGGPTSTSGGIGQVVETNMVDGAAYLGTFLRLSRKTPLQDGPRGTNLLDGGCPWYDVYETRDQGQYMAVGALEPQFFALLVQGLGLDESWNERRWDRDAWPELRELMDKSFRSRTRREWEHVFAGKDACCTPVLGQRELEEQGYEQRPAVGLSRTPARKVDQVEAWTPKGLAPGEGGERVLAEWLGWERGREYVVEKGGLVKSAGSKL